MNLAIRQFALFSTIGILNTLIHYGMFYLLFKAFGVHYLISSSIGYCCGLINSYIMNRNITFKVTNRKNVLEFFKFILVNIVAFSVNLVLMKSLVDLLEIQPEISQMIAIIGSTAANFLGNKFWTFKERYPI